MGRAGTDRNDLVLSRGGPKQRKRAPTRPQAGARVGRPPTQTPHAERDRDAGRAQRLRAAGDVTDRRANRLMVYLLDWKAAPSARCTAAPNRNRSRPRRARDRDVPYVGGDGARAPPTRPVFIGSDNYTPIA
ncbi:hypothetical protein EVAR_63701_1 [Eumeta japonica]|uniref:Uncharacterized protein n=1 Tax=Eumeta variegata TaxID=151549 RepID=A0A4C1ZX09_EUMVA|nr:hypothetical protein EVAR_63701_1 [Eumeta japonica]